MKSSQIALGKVFFDPETGRLTNIDGKATELRHQSLQVLGELVAQRGKTVSRTEFFDRVWGGRHVGEDSLAQCIAEIRTAIGDNEKRIVQTVPRQGYRLAAAETAAISNWRSGQLALAMAVAAAIIYAVYAHISAGRAPPGPPVVAVLPFDDLSPGPNRGFLSDAISDGIITNLANYPELQVISRESSFQFRNSPAVIRKIADMLGADFVLEGSQQYDGKTLRVNAQLIETQGNAHVWADELDVPLHDIFEVNALVGRRITNAVSSAIVDVGNPSGGEGPDSALELNLKGWRLMRRQLSRENMAKGLAFAEEAVKRFPDEPWGYVGVAILLRNAVRWGWTDEPDPQVLQRAYGAARHAVEMAPDSYLTHFALGRVLMQNGHVPEAIGEFERAAKLNPSSSMVLGPLGQGYLYVGETNKVFEIVRTIEQINPTRDRVMIWLKAWAYWQAGDCGNAQSTIETMSAPPVESFKLHAVIQNCLGHAEKAKSYLASYLEQHPGWTARREIEMNEASWTADGALARWVSALKQAGLPEG